MDMPIHGPEESADGVEVNGGPGEIVQISAETILRRRKSGLGHRGRNTSITAS